MPAKLETDTVSYERVSPDVHRARITRAKVECDVTGDGETRQAALAAAQAALLAELVPPSAPPTAPEVTQPELALAAAAEAPAVEENAEEGEGRRRKRH